MDAAIRATIAMPGFFTPVMIGGRLLAATGIMNPVPVAAITAARADITAAVSLTGERTVDVLNLSLEAMQSVLPRCRLSGYPPELLVTVPADACRAMDFHLADEMIQLGRDLTNDTLHTLDSLDTTAARRPAHPTAS